MAGERLTGADLKSFSSIRKVSGRRIHRGLTPGQKDRVETITWGGLLKDAGSIARFIERNRRGDNFFRKRNNAQPQESDHCVRSFFIVGNVIGPVEGFKLAYRKAFVYPRSKP